MELQTCSLAALTLFAIMVSKTSCHLCMISPPQRGTMMGLNKPASTDCILLKAPCGGRPFQGTILTLKAGEKFPVVFQKNLNHWNQTSPGKFVVSIGYESKELMELVSIPDRNEPNLHLYTAMVTIPKLQLNKNNDHLVIQTKYQTNNPEAPSVFYQCSDILIEKDEMNDPHIL